MTCRNCEGTGWVCENHRDVPWGGHLASEQSCECGAGAPCPVCNAQMACAGYSEPWRQLALSAIQSVESAVRETSWGVPTFGPDEGEALRAEYNALIAKAVQP